MAQEVHASGPLLLQAEELRGLELHDGPLPPPDVPADLLTQNVTANPAEIVSGFRQHGPLARSGRACKSCRDCSAVEQHSKAAAAVLSVPAGPTPGQELQQQQQRCRPHPCNRLLDRRRCQDSSPPKHPCSQSLLQQATRFLLDRSHSCSSSTAARTSALGSCWTDSSARTARRPIGSC